MACAVSVANLCRVRGDTTQFTVTVTTNGTTPIDITGFAFAFTVDPSEEPIDNTNNLFQLTVGSGLTITDGPNGVLTIGLSPANADQTPGEYFYDLQMTDGGGLVTTILRGTYEVSQDITK